MSEGVTPLPEPIESTLKHDPYINGKFIAIFDHPDNADVVRQANMILAMNDPEREPAMTPKNSEADDPKDVMVGKDADGDFIHAAYSKTNGRLLFRTNERGFYMPMEKVPGFIKWLQSRLDKYNGVAE